MLYIFFFSFFRVLDIFSLLTFFLAFIFVILFWYMGRHDGVFFLDYLSLLLLFVSFWVYFFTIIILKGDYLEISIYWLILLLTFFSFSIRRIIIFYVSFEAIFLLIFFYLIGWGKTAERFQASFYMFFYTLAFSLPFLIVLVIFKTYLPVSFFFGGISFWITWTWFFVLLLFIVKLPLFGFHVWLPKAHVEAPVRGSILLAGVLLKLGGYGLLRFLPFMQYVRFSFSLLETFFFYQAILGALLVSFFCIRQIDLKIVIAYSSVVHMRVIFLGLFSYKTLGMLGGTIIIVAHGFLSPLLFFLISLFYDFFNSRRNIVIKGLMLVSPLLCVAWFLRCFLNLGIPPFISFFSEISILGSIRFLRGVDWLVIGASIFIAGAYCVYMYVMPTHGVRLLPVFFYLDLKSFVIFFLSLFFVLSFPLFFFYQ